MIAWVFDAGLLEVAEAFELFEHLVFNPGGYELEGWDRRRVVSGNRAGRGSLQEGGAATVHVLAGGEPEPAQDGRGHVGNPDLTGLGHDDKQSKRTSIIRVGSVYPGVANSHPL